MKGICFWCGAFLDRHDETNPAVVNYGPHVIWPVEGKDNGVAPVPVVGKGDKLNESS